MFRRSLNRFLTAPLFIYLAVTVALLASSCWAVSLVRKDESVDWESFWETIGGIAARWWEVE